MNPIWILVANQAEARIYSASRLSEKLTPVHTLTHAEGAAHVGDLTDDEPGRVHDRMGPARHSMEPGAGIKAGHRRRFAKEIVARLEAAHMQGEFNRLVILAAPAMLGAIRKAMSTDISSTVIKELSKDVVGQGLDKIQEQLRRAFTNKSEVH
ncbi:MAG: host attachment protein [Proteobacteria bacterium]|nr:host attachment protein [Pseudomonadota bacterium]